MSAIPQPNPLGISNQVIKPLREIVQRHWIVMAAVGALQTLILSLTILLAGALLLGYFPHMPYALRVPVAILTWATVLWSAVRFLRPALRRLSIEEAAHKVELKAPGFQERLSSSVELSKERDERFRGSRSLIAHLFSQAEKDALGVKPDAVVRTDRVTKFAVALAPVILAWLLITFTHPLPVEAGLFRLFDPFGHTLPAALSEVAVTPGDITLAQGDDLEIGAVVSAAIGDKGKALDHVQLASIYASGQNVMRDMETVGPRQFKTKLTDLQEGFKYRVQTPVADSGWYTVKVNPRPAVASLEVRYVYPTYTGIEPLNVPNSDGTVEAIVGTKVTLVVHTTGALMDKNGKKNQIVIDQGNPTETPIAITPMPGSTTDYQAAFVVSHSAEYHIQLCNEFGLTNKDDGSRTIIAHFDQPPTIAILTPDDGMEVRPNDTVPVTYQAADDFAVAKIEALLQVDDKPLQTHELHLPAGDRRNVNGVYALNVASILQEAGAAEGKEIHYQLKVTDNRDPDPQSGLSQRQLLKINRYVPSFNEQVNQKQGDHVNAELDKAQQELTEAEQKSAPLHNADPNHQLTPDEKKQAQEAQEELAKVNQELHDLAKQDQQTPLADVTKKAADVADDKVEKAAEDTAKAEMEDKAQDRANDANDAQQQISKARDALNQLKDELQHAERVAKANEELRQASQLQQEAAKGFAEHPEQRDANQQKQREAMAKLQEAIQNDPRLQDPKAQQLAQQLANLANHVEDLQKQETQQQNQTAKQEQQAQVQAQANDLAQKQEQLNDQIHKFVDADHPQLDQAHTDVPNADQRKEIVNALQRNNVDDAANRMKDLANHLQQTSQQLQNTANSNDPTPSQAEQQARQQDQQRTNQARDEQNRANQAAQDLRNDANQVNKDAPKPQEAAIQHAEEQAKAIEDQANALHAPDANAQKEAAAAHHDAEQAAADAQKAEHDQNADQAKQDLQNAANELAQAGQELAQAADDTAKADQAAQVAQDKAQDAQAAQQAQALAKAQEDLAAQAAAEKPAADEARRDALQPDQAAQQQNQVADQTHQAAAQADELKHQAEQAPNADLAHRAADAQAALAQATAEQQQAAQAEAHGDPDHAAEHQDAAQAALAKAENALRGVDPAQMAQADAHADDAHPDAAQPDAAHPDSAHADSGQPDNGQGNDPGQANPGQDQAQANANQPLQTPAQLQQQAAQAVQEAAAVQPQALQPDPLAAEEAAKELAMAAKANAQAQPGQPHAPEAMSPDHDPSHHPDANAGEVLVSSQGIQSSMDGQAGARPEPVKALGISASDWARLPALMRKELLNAAQQNGPAAYREMIKNYYVRIARQQTQAAVIGPQQD